VATRLRIASLNVLADSYTGNGDYRHAPADLMRRGARIGLLTSLITRLDADVTGLQEVEWPLVMALAATGRWQTIWSKKEDAPDGCLTLVKNNLVVDSSETLRFNDGSGHVAQIVKIGGVAVANTHIKWELPHRTAQVTELLAGVATEACAVLVGDFNDRPGEPARALVAEAGFTNLAGDMPTAYIANREGPASIDLFAVRGLEAELSPVEFGEDFDITEIPSRRCASDHTPLVGQITLP
jgi:mRNA deadenylase 3'-5' endonuclease subunit Ccr4